MSQTPDITMTELLKYTQSHAGAASAKLSEFIPAYFDNTDPDELLDRGPATLFAIATAHWRLLEAPRAAGAAKVRVFNPTLAEDGFVSEHTAIQIVQDDMPFLVDSVTMAINRSGRTAHWIVHPLLAVQRDDTGRILKAGSAASVHGDGTQEQSLILVECDRILNDTDRQALTDDLNQVLGDVRAVVNDWAPMLARLNKLCAESSQSASNAIKREEGIDFLLWLQDKHFTFLGARDYDLVRDGNAVNLVARENSGLGILRGPVQTPVSQLPAEAMDMLDSDQLVLVTKAMTRATVHRPAWLDYIAVKRFDASG